MRGGGSAGGGEPPPDMDEQLAAQKESGEFAGGPCGWLSSLLFLWPDSLFRAANARPPGGGPPMLPLRAVFRLSASDRVDPLAARFEALLAAAAARAAGGDVEDGRGPVRAALTEMFWRPMAAAGAVKFVNSTLQFAPSLLLYGLLNAISSEAVAAGTPAWPGYAYAAALGLAIVARVLTENNYFQRVVRVGFQIRAALTAAIYRKALRMSPTARQETPVGKIVNLMQLDSTRLESLMMQLHVSWDAFYQILGYMAILSYFVGAASLAGLATMVVLVPVQGFFMKALGRRRGAIAKATDLRIKVTNEALQGIRTLKQYNWEDAYADIIGKHREAELNAIWSYSMVGSFNSTLMFIAPLVVGAVTLLAYSAGGGEFTAARVFSALAVLNGLRFPLMFLPMISAWLRMCARRMGGGGDNGGGGGR